ncbi:hypothetical protein [Novosphingobium humi]|uniref:hypothetical protein n=1 Tax=Novosphingobium humi TaxID=2282397 RepID=UPI0025AF1EF4|nr:hypothetical protein [Novosphingobium humi]WJS98226.1 hypothetical protein NYQ05_13995 [Novosphingobium humi]
MTKIRQPLTPYRALCRIEEVLGWDGIATVIEKNVWHCRKMSDPDTGREISLRDAARLDAAYQRAGGIGAPLREAFDALLTSLSDQEVDPADLLTASSRAAKEAGEAVSAALDAARREGCPVARRVAVKEAEEGIASLLSLISALNAGETA